MRHRPAPDPHNASHVLALSTETPAYCAVCRRRAGHCGHGGIKRALLWTCSWDECGAGLERIRAMSTPDFDELEMQGLVAAARAGKSYLESIGAGALVSAFADLEPNQALEFLERVVDGFGCHLKSKLVINRGA